VACTMQQHMSDDEVCYCFYRTFRIRLSSFFYMSVDLLTSSGTPPCACMCSGCVYAHMVRLMALRVWHGF
jgi:hypothetical protein